jgi:hypothetical protein
LGVQTAIFSVGDYRRRMVGTQMAHDFFNSVDTATERMRVAEAALDDLVQWFNEKSGQVGFLFCG